MSDLTPKLSMPFLQPAQAQKHVTHNEAIEILDLLVQLTVESFDAQTPPGTALEGQTWALGVAPTGAWAGQAGRLATWRGGGWLYVAPREGWRAYGRVDAAMKVYSGTAWVALAGPPALQNLTSVGINATADTTNRLSVAATASLFNHAGAGHQMKLNKAASANTASLLYQSGFSGRAEMGLVGSDDFAIKVSPAGNTFTTAQRIEAANAISHIRCMDSLRVTIPDDTKLDIPTPSTGGFVFVTLVDPDQPQPSHSGIFVYDTGPTPALAIMTKAVNLDHHGTDPVTGTTSLDGRSGIGAKVGALVLENRFGATRSYSLTFIGGM